MKIAVLLSGGVDSSLALALLVAAGHDCTAFYLKIWLEDETAFLGSCPWEEDLTYARATCERLGVPLEVVPLQREYHDRVVAYALDELRAGRTPSPDLFCNERIKFGAFYGRIDTAFERVATGHYARLERDASGEIRLLRAPDPVKDQSYFLAHLSAAQLARAEFPVGGLHKAEVRAEALRLDLPAKSRPDSQGVCFLGKIRFRDFARAYLGELPGDIVDAATGRRLGPHAGYWLYTIGQREGLGLSGGPWYVVGKDVAANRILVAGSEPAAAAARTGFSVTEASWINGAPPAGEYLCKLRHGPRLHACRWTPGGGGASGHVSLLDGADRGLAAGQFAVFYAGETCLGCARIA